MAFECPNCQSPARVVDSRRGEAGTRRRYVCEGRNLHRFTTLERPAEGAKTTAEVELQERRRAIARMYLVLDEMARELGVNP